MTEKTDWSDPEFPMRNGQIDWGVFWFDKTGPIPIYCFENECLAAEERARIRQRLATEWQKLTPAEQQAARNFSRRQFKP